ncbi:1-acyl-sn-glycerol-3-phosphate acyltransferase [Lysobacter sp. TY2-98]|uniref:lysophospholipid acyltransferase family protein n=1 Tax=Lysobacter sp. TY2-98 TaxID=2290922 RepID=UPI000E1FBD0F|nr:lysophospholipid acyltransferase family protein [Lysobacter sp. TY2-98]AXK73060.1 1-acyl-sn-glycerol-3-phosphate acyltransferase [Lysobacter sp. TY2-98]
MSASTESLTLVEPWPLRAAWLVANAVQLTFTLLWTAGCISLALLVRAITRSARVPLRMASWLWAPGLLGGAGARVDVRGVENVDWSKPCVLVATHESIIDICALFRAVPVPLRFMLKQEMTRVPFVGWYAKAMGMCFIERDGSRASMVKSLRAAAEIVKAGHVLCIFPEGTRNTGGRVGEFKAGAFQVALSTGVPVIPVAMTGAGAVLPPYSFRVRPGTIRLRIGTPIHAEGTGGEAREQLATRARDAVMALMAQD